MISFIEVKGQSGEIPENECNIKVVLAISTGCSGIVMSLEVMSLIVLVMCVCMFVHDVELSSDSTDQEPVDDVRSVTTDTVYSNLASLLTALQSARPAGHTLDTCPVNNFCCLLSVSLIDISELLHVCAYS